LAITVTVWADTHEGRDLSNINLSNGNHKVELDATEKVSGKGGSKNRLHFEFTTNGFPRWRARFYARSSDSVDGFKFRVGLFAVVEYNDTGSGFDPTRIVKAWRLFGDTSNWSQLSETQTTVNGFLVYNFETVNAAGPDGASLTIDVGIAPEYLLDLTRNRTVTPSALKWDVKLNNWVYSAPASRLAFIYGVDAASRHVVRQHDSDAPSQVANNNEGGVTVEDGSPTLGTGFSWTPLIHRRLAGLWADSTIHWTAMQAGTGSGLDSFLTGQGDDDSDPDEVRRVIAFYTADRATDLEWDPALVMGSTGAQVTVSLFTLLVSFLAHHLLQ